jgi:hypothetical protein
LGNGPVIYDGAAQLPDRYQWHKPHLALRRLRQRRDYTAGLDGNLHLPRRAIPNANGYAHSNSNGYRYSNCGSFGDAYRNSNSYSHSRSYSYCYSDAYLHTETNPDAKRCAFAKAAPDSAAAAVACSGIWKR